MNAKKRIQFLKKFAQSLSSSHGELSIDQIELRSFNSHCEHHSNIIQDNLHKLFKKIYERKEKLELKKKQYNDEDKIPQTLNEEIEKLTEKLSSLRTMRTRFYNEIYNYFN